MIPLTRAILSPLEISFIITCLYIWTERCHCVVAAGVNKTWCLSTMLTTLAAIRLLLLTASMI